MIRVQQVPAETAERLNALLDRQAEAVARLAGLEVNRASLQAEVPRLDRADLRAVTIELGQLEAHMATTRAQLAETRRNIAELRAPAAGSLQVPRSEQMFGWSKDEFMGVLTFLLLLPIVIAVARRIWIRTNRGAAQEVVSDDRLDRIERAVESVAIEVERIGESQRYTSRLLTERNAELPVPARQDSAPRPVITPRP